MGRRIGDVDYTDAQCLTIAIAELASALGVCLDVRDFGRRDFREVRDWELVERITAHVRDSAQPSPCGGAAARAAFNEYTRKPLLIAPASPEREPRTIDARLASVERLAHPAYDFATLVARVEALEARHEADVRAGRA